MKIEVGFRYNNANYKCHYDSSEEWRFKGPNGDTHYHAGKKEGALGIEANDSEAVYLIELDAFRRVVGVKGYDHKLHFGNIQEAIKEYEAEKYNDERDF